MIYSINEYTPINIQQKRCLYWFGNETCDMILMHIMRQVAGTGRAIYGPDDYAFRPQYPLSQMWCKVFLFLLEQFSYVVFFVRMLQQRVCRSMDAGVINSQNVFCFSGNCISGWNLCREKNILFFSSTRTFFSIDKLVKTQTFHFN